MSVQATLRSTLSVAALPGLPEITSTSNLAAEIIKAISSLEHRIASTDLLVVAQKVVSKSEGRTASLTTVSPGEAALALSETTGKDPRLLEIILSETAQVVRATRGVLICRTHHGFVCANAGVDCSNTGPTGRVVLLPLDCDKSARTLRSQLRDELGYAPAVVISDSFGRAWRNGQVEVALGCAGLQPVADWREKSDGDGRELSATVIAIADQAAAAADLVRTKASREPVVRITGLDGYITEADGEGIVSALVRPLTNDLFR